MKMYNFKTGRYEDVELPVEDWSNYIPQDRASQALYKVYQKMGYTPREAARKVLILWTGEID